MRKLTYIAFFIFFQTTFGQSVLSNGDWYKVGIAETGIYKLSRSNLADLGINVSSVDPRTIRIFGNGVKGTLPQGNDEDRPFDLQENAIQIIGENDGSFDESDYILFYAIGPDKYDWSDTGLTYKKNIYSDSAFYFITIGGTQGKRIANHSSVEGTSVSVSSFTDYEIFEEDVNNLLGSGRGWYGELMASGDSYSATHSLEGIISDIELKFKAASQSPETNSFTVFANSGVVGSLNIESIPNGPGTTYSIKAKESEQVFTITQNVAVSLRFQFEGNSPSARGFMDYYQMTFNRNLQLYGNQTAFRSTENVGEIISYQISNASNTTIWNVTDPINVGNQLFSINGSIGSFKSQHTLVEEFVVFAGSDFPTPTGYGNVPNQDLKGYANYDGIIVSHPLFIQQAEELALFHETTNSLLIRVVTPEQIYNEFSSGRQDVTAIRDYAKFVYEEGTMLKYLLLFGDCSYDYKDRIDGNTNFVPTYESRDSFHPIFSHSSDDFFGFFEEDEGNWEESGFGDHTMEIGIGRLPAKNEEEAAVMIDKINYYTTSPNTLGTWRNQIAYLADDGDGNIHASHVEELSELIDTTYLQYRIDKLLLDAFDQDVGATLESSPETTRALKTRIKEGAFTINFIGHGNEEQWMDEVILTNEVIADLTNRNKMPIFITATCEFGRYDDPRQESGAEKLLLNKNGGAIALLTTSRPVFASTNFELNEAFHQNVFRKVDGANQRLGDIIKITKNEGLAGPVNRNFTLLGDPMMMPAFPQFDIQINELVSFTDTLSALEEVTLTGQVLNNGGLVENFNGELSISLFDEKQTFKTKGQQSQPYNYTVRSNAIFRGKSTVTEGSFSFTFVVPKTISYQFNKGKLSLYAWDKSSNIDAAGSSNNLLIGGTNNSAPADNLAPQVTMYLNDETFINGTTVAESSMLFAKVSDDNGITTSGNGLIQGISLELNDQIISLNEFYTADLNTYKSGVVAYPIQDLAPGEYTAVLKVHDTHNNLTTSSINFTVVDGVFISVFNPIAYPNPAGPQTTFSFEHDREEEDLDLILIVYNARGDIVNRTNYEYENSNRLVEINWQTKTNSGQPLNRGVYYYRLLVKSRFDGAVKEITNKLVIAN